MSAKRRGTSLYPGESQQIKEGALQKAKKAILDDCFPWSSQLWTGRGGLGRKGEPREGSKSGWTRKKKTEKLDQTVTVARGGARVEGPLPIMNRKNEKQKDGRNLIRYRKKKRGAKNAVGPTTRTGKASWVKVGRPTKKNTGPT